MKINPATFQIFINFHNNKLEPVKFTLSAFENMAFQQIFIILIPNRIRSILFRALSFLFADATDKLFEGDFSRNIQKSCTIFIYRLQHSLPYIKTVTRLVIYKRSSSSRRLFGWNFPIRLVNRDDLNRLINSRIGSHSSSGVISYRFK